jgi:hypothetical protein
MTNINQLRHQLLKRIQKIPQQQLQELDNYAAKLESIDASKEKILSYAGIWKDLDSELFDELTENIHGRRADSKRRVNE